MKKGIIVSFVCLLIGIFLQFILVETAPQFPCYETTNHLLGFLKIIGIEYFILLLILMCFNKYLLKITNKETIISIVIFTAIYILSFSYLFIKYANKCIEVSQ